MLSICGANTCSRKISGCNNSKRIRIRNVTGLTVCVLLVFLCVLQFRDKNRSDFTREILHENDRFRETRPEAEMHTIGANKNSKDKPASVRHPVYITDERLDEVLNSTFTVLERLGLKRQLIADGNDWDLLWAYNYPFYDTSFSRNVLTNLQPHQRVNHFPAASVVTNKARLASMNLPGIPRSFRIPVQSDKLRDYAKKNPDVMFVKKGKNHEGIQIANVDDLDLRYNNFFVQEFKNRPLLIDGHKFDIAVYTILTSVDPLRVFVYEGEALLRFCPEKYHPFDPNNTSKYVIMDNQLAASEIKSLRKYIIDEDMSMKESLNAYLRTLGKDPTTIWIQIEEILARVFYRAEEKILLGTRKYKSKRNFFELFRSDFFIDENLNLFLMEVNFTPDLNKRRSLQIYSQLLYNLFGLVNVGRRTHTDSLKIKAFAEHNMLVSDKNLMVFPETCTSDLCRGSCDPLECKLCKRCLTPDTRLMLEDAYLEEQNRMSCKRIVPPAVTFDDAAKPEVGKQGRGTNYLMQRWFQGKCLQDRSWCHS